MKKNTLLTFALLCISQSAFSQSSRHKHPVEVPNTYTAYFAEAYSQHPDVPNGILEAVAFTETRFQQLQHNTNEAPSCTGIPLVYGVMGLTLDGKNYFHNNLALVANLSGYSTDDIMSSPEKCILAYAAAFSKEKQILGITSNTIEDQVPVLKALSALPDSTVGQQYALNSDIYEMLNFLNTPSMQKYYSLPVYSIDMTKVFGADDLKILSSPQNTLQIDNKPGSDNRAIKPHSPDYGPAIWNPAASCNYQVGRSAAVSAVVIHDMEGSYASSIAWFQNCSSVVSAHYCIRSSDGQITQMVLESNTAWHVGSENSYTVGIEHEGYAASTGWYTDTMYATSSKLVSSHLCPAYSILSTRVASRPWAATTDYAVASIPGACTLIKGHQHYPHQTHTDPGANWDWDYYYKLINDGNYTSYNTYTTATGSFYDDGGPSGNYNNDERSVTVIAPKGATTVTVNFSSYSTENTWDYMYIYDGNSVWAPLIGYYTSTTSPGTIKSTGNALCFEFRSDCATTSTGWAATWTANGVTGIASTMDANAVKVYPNPSDGKFTIELKGNSEKLKAEVFNVLGEKVYSNTFLPLNSSFLVDMSNSPSGVYFLKITGEELSYTSRLVKN